MGLQNLKYMQDETRRLIGKAVIRLNTQGVDISREAIIDTLNSFVDETDDKDKQRVINDTINMFIVTNGRFMAI